MAEHQLPKLNTGVRFPSSALCDVARHRKLPNPHSGFGRFRFSRSVGSFRSADWCAGAVVAAVGVDREGAQDFAGGGVDDAHVEVVDEHDDGGSVEVSADADVVQLAGDA